VPPIDLVTGAFGFTGSRIAARLLAGGRDVRTISRRAPAAHPLSGRVSLQPYEFGPGRLAESLRGVDTLYVTYWMRYERGGATFDQLVANVGRLIRAAADSGVRRLVYSSVVNASHSSPTAYFRAKAATEDLVRASGLSYAIIRPTLLYGDGDILINNMAWTLRRFPLFGVPGDGRYRVQPVHVDDVADLNVQLGLGDQPMETDACGPDVFTFDELVRLVAGAVGRPARLVHLPPALVLATTRLIGLAVRDVVLTRDEIRELTSSLLTSDGPPTCATRLPDWLAEHGDRLGRRWASELGRNYRLARSS
jgi:NADH dehydrogenase